jgi:hypothetical protein
MGTIFVDKLDPQSGTNLTLGSSGDTVTLTSGAKTSGFGKIGQVVSTSKTDSFNTTSTSFTDITGMSVSITPTTTSSKVLILLNAPSILSQANNQVWYMKLLRGSTAIGGGATDDAFRMCYSASVYDPAQVSYQFLDSPSTTSSTTYKLQVKVSGDTYYLNTMAGGTASASSITAMEILD